MEGYDMADKSVAASKSARAGAREAEDTVRRDMALRIIRRNSAYGAIAGLIPLPVIDMAAITTVQIKMIADMSAVYEVPFARNSVKSAVTALIGSSLPFAVAMQGGFSLARGIPVVGQIAAVAVVPALAAAITWAVGRVFLAHFEAGGTLLDFDPDKWRGRFKEEFEKARGREKTTAEASSGEGAPATG
jgi:uncharacterized protein (DUF697 family)